MYLLDTDHLSVLERGGEESLRLRQRLRQVVPQEVAASVISYEEQTRGWFGFMAKSRSLEEQIAAYGFLQSHLQLLCAVPLIAFSPAAAAIAQQLQKQRVHIGTLAPAHHHTSPHDTVNPAATPNTLQAARVRAPLGLCLGRRVADPAVGRCTAGEPSLVDCIAGGLAACAD